MNELKATLRPAGENTRALRRAHRVPGCIDCAGAGDSTSISVDENELAALLRRQSRGSLLTLVLDGRKQTVLLRDFTREPVGGGLQHVGLQELDAARPLNSTVRIVVQNREKINGSVLQHLTSLDYTALPADLVDVVTIDLEGCQPGTSITVGDLPLAHAEGIELHCEPDRPVVTIAEARRAVQTHG